MDPLLRKVIWGTLSEVASEGCTVIITTHYIEEAALAHKVGFLRQGRLLTEGSPKQLTSQYQLQSLEKVFYKLCYEDDQDQLDAIKGVVDLGVDIIEGGSELKVRKMNAFNALLSKNMKVLKRHWTFMVFQTLLPLVSYLVFIGAIGQPIRDLGLAVHNEDSDKCALITGIKDNITCPTVNVANFLINGFDELSLGQFLIQ